jgi:hypothetical protein
MKGTHSLLLEGFNRNKSKHYTRFVRMNLFRPTFHVNLSRRIVLSMNILLNAAKLKINHRNCDQLNLAIWKQNRKLAAVNQGIPAIRQKTRITHNVV